jgi:hypothetical protein
MKKPLTERHIEKAVKEAALKLGYITYKFTSASNRGVPDRLFINPNGYMFFIEFKTRDGKVTALQSKVFEDLGKYKVDVFIMNDIEQATKLLKILLSIKIYVENDLNLPNVMIR